MDLWSPPGLHLESVGEGKLHSQCRKGREDGPQSESHQMGLVRQVQERAWWPLLPQKEQE
jgi:hypothetical protein